MLISLISSRLQNENIIQPSFFAVKRIWVRLHAIQLHLDR